MAAWSNPGAQRVVALRGTNRVEKGVILEQMENDMYKIQWALDATAA